jgi:hypothetical protein
MRNLLLQRFPSCWHRRGVTGHQPSDNEILASLPDRPGLGICAARENLLAIAVSAQIGGLTWMGGGSVSDRWIPLLITLNDANGTADQ